MNDEIISRCNEAAGPMTRPIASGAPGPAPAAAIGLDLVWLLLATVLDDENDKVSRVSWESRCAQHNSCIPLPK